MDGWTDGRINRDKTAYPHFKKKSIQIMFLTCLLTFSFYREMLTSDFVFCEEEHISCLYIADDVLVIQIMNITI